MLKYSVIIDFFQHFSIYNSQPSMKDMSSFLMSSEGWLVLSHIFINCRLQCYSLAGSKTQTEQEACSQPFTQTLRGVTKAWEEVLLSGPPGAYLHFISAQRAALNPSLFYCQVVIYEQSAWPSSACHLSPHPAADLYETN